MTFGELVDVLNCKIDFDILDNDNIISCQEWLNRDRIDNEYLDNRVVLAIFPCDSRKSPNNKLTIKLK